MLIGRPQSEIVERGVGLHGRTPEKRVLDAQTGAKAAVAMKRGVHDPQNFGKGLHMRWHAQRGKTSPTCRWCAAELKIAA
jgi:hypothetical protein